jgi:hypothetical protein
MRHCKCEVNKTTHLFETIEFIFYFIIIIIIHFVLNSIFSIHTDAAAVVWGTRESRPAGNRFQLENVALVRLDTQLERLVYCFLNN